MASEHEDQRHRAGEVDRHEGAREQQRDHQRHQQRRDRAERDRDVDEQRAPLCRAQLLPCLLGRPDAGIAQALADPARAVHDARESVGEHAEEHPDAGEQEHGCHRQLDRVRDVDDFDSVHGRAF